MIVAIIDDEAAVRNALSRLLGACSIHTRSYATARDFLNSLPSDKPDCLIVDLQMPGMTGIELLEQLTRSGLAIPSIVITAHGDTELRKRCLATGALAYLTKPFDGTVLLASLNSAGSQAG